MSIIGGKLVKNKDDEKLDFVTDSSFSQTVRKAKRKQLGIQLALGLIAAVIILVTFYFVASYNLNKKIEENTDQILFSKIKGANMSYTSMVNVYSFLNATTVITTEKTIGDRSIIWEKTHEEVPALGKKTVINSGKEKSFSDLLKRNVTYNNFNGEKEVVFYYPNTDYEMLPNEVELIKGLNENSLVEVGLSFDKAYSLEDLEEMIGSENVEWLWVYTNEPKVPNATQGSKRILPIDNTLGAASANGFRISEQNFNAQAESFLRNLEELSQTKNYKSEAKKMINGINNSNKPKPRDIKISGAVVTGTPKELIKFQQMNFIRASTIGATIDLY
jgi:Sigma factor regulator C-terminal